MSDSSYRLLLFDVDGVLIQARGYRAALKQTVDWFTTRMGLSGMAPADADIDGFEANGLSSEWESCPLCIGAIFLAALQADPALRLQGDLAANLAAVQAARPAASLPDYAAFARQVGQELRPGDRPSLLSEQVLTRTAERVLAESQIGGYRAVLHSLLDDTHDLPTAWVTQVFQHYSLGSEAYQRCYGLPIQFQSPSLLANLDIPALTAESRERLRQALATDHTRAAIYTARPTLPPIDQPGPTTGYAPEGEIARELVELGELPLIGFGRVQWLAAQIGARPDAFVKPSPIQALAAIGAAWSGSERQALEAAYRLARHGELAEPLHSLMLQPGGEVVVLEDSAAGVQAVRVAVEQLNQAARKIGGSSLRLQAVGVTSATGPKWAALQPLCTAVVQDVNQALHVLAI